MKKTPKELRDLVELDLSRLEAIVGGGSAEQNRAGMNMQTDGRGGSDTLFFGADSSTITGGMHGRAFTEE